VLGALGRRGVNRTGRDITKASAKAVVAAKATFTTMRIVNVTVVLQDLLRDAGTGASARAGGGGSDDANTGPRRASPVGAKEISGAASPANRTRSLTVLTRYRNHRHGRRPG